MAYAKPVNLEDKEYSKLSKLFTEFNIKNVRIKNHIGVPPMAVAVSEEGYVTQKIVEHYKKIAQGGAGLIIQEATCVNIDGRFSNKQLGIWNDGQIKGLKQIVEEVHKEDCKIFIQIQYSGLTGISEKHICPSPCKYEIFGKMYEATHEMKIDEIKSIQNDYIHAVRRAFEAGYDGVELHGSKSFLISQFLNSKINRRDDEYGKMPEKFVIEILERIRQIVPNTFIVGIRLGGFESRIEDGIRHATMMEKYGVDFIDIADGFFGEKDAQISDSYPYSHTVYAAQKIKEQVRIPVFAVGGIKTAKNAEEIFTNTNVDVINVGRAFLENPNWANDARNGM